MTQPDDVDPSDRGLLRAAEVGLFSERVVRPLEPWQQDLVDRIMVTAAKGERLHLVMPRMHGRRAVNEALDRWATDGQL